MKEIGLRLEFKKMRIYASEDWEEENDNQDEIEEIEYELTKKYDEIDQLDKQLGKEDTNIKVDPKNVVQEMFKNKIIGTSRTERADEKSKDLNKTGLKSPKSSRISEFLNRQNEMKKEPPILNQIESLNTDIPDNQEKFRVYFGGLRPKAKNNEQQNEYVSEKYMDTEEETEEVKIEATEPDQTTTAES